MPISSKLSEDKQTILITITGSFDFSLQSEFRSTYRSITRPDSEFRVNLQNTEYMDSSALGMLLLLREHAETYKGRVVLESLSPEIKQILTNAKFDRLFTIEG